MKHYELISILLILLSVNLYTQEKKLLEITENLNLILLEPVSDVNQVIFKKCNDKLYFTSIIINEDSISYFDLVSIDNSNQKNNYKIIIPNKLLDRIWLKDFEICQDELYLNLQYEISVFYLDEDNQFKFKKSIPKNKIFQGIRIYNNIIYGYACKFNETNDESLTYLWKYNLSDNTEELKYYKDPEGIEWTKIQPRSLIDIRENKLIISDANKYRIYVYNISDNTIIDSIIVNDEISNHNLINLPNLKTKNFNSKLQKITNYLFENRTKVDIIESVKILSDKKILVIKSIGDSINEKCLKYYDLWEFDNKKWVRTHKNLISGMPKKDLDFSFNDFFIDNMLISENYFISFHPIPFTINDYHFNLKFKDIYKLREEYVEHNDIRYSLLIGTFK